MSEWRTSNRNAVRIPGARVRARVTSGLADLSLCIDYDAVRKRDRAERDAARKPTRAEIAARIAAEEPQEHALLCAAWENAPKGDDKRTALAALRAHEARHGRMPYKGELLSGRIIDVSTGAESWLEVK